MTPHRFRWIFSIITATVAGSTSPAMGQMDGRSLGGYGSATITSFYATRSSPYAPYAGGGSGYAPRPSAMSPPSPLGRGVAGTPIGGASQAMLAARAAVMAEPSGRTPRRPLPMTSGIGSGGMMGSGVEAKVMPSPRTGPGLGWPFRMPPALPGRGSMGMGGP